MPSDIKQCPYCAEDIKATAIVCKHCGRELPKDAQSSEAAPPTSTLTTQISRDRIIYGLIGVIAVIGIAFFAGRSSLNSIAADNTDAPAAPATESVFSEVATQALDPTELPTSAPPTHPPTLPPTGIAEVTIPASEAHEYEGQSVTVEIPKAYCSYRPTTNGEPTFCNDQPFPGHNFTLLVWGQDWSHFDGQCIWVTGTVELFEGISEIVVDTPSQVTLCPE